LKATIKVYKCLDIFTAEDKPHMYNIYNVYFNATWFTQQFM